MRYIVISLLLMMQILQASGASSRFEGEKTSWHGRDCYRFSVCGRDAIAVVPDKPLEGNPWVWRPAFFDAFPSIDDALLDAGFYITYFDTTNEWGRPEALEAGQQFYELMTGKYGLMPKAVMCGLSRGGYYSLKRGEEYPSTVACMILDNPLVDLFELKRNDEWWSDVKEKWHLDEKVPERGEFRENAAYNVKKAAAAGVPVLLLSGGQDTIVPYERNGRIVKDTYRRYGAPIRSIVRPSGEHHPHGLDNAAAVVPYVMECVYGTPAAQKPLKVACIGNSITAGVGTSDPATKAYPAVLQRLLGDGFEVRNFGVSSSTVLKKGTDAGQPFAYSDSEACRKAVEWSPDIVVLKLGGNDSKPNNWQYKDDFDKDYQAIIDTFKYLPSLPEIYICLPAKARVDDPSKIWGINEAVIAGEITPRIEKIAHDNRLKTIDLHDVYAGEENECYSDNIHPTDRGAELLGRRIYKVLSADF